MHCLLFAKKRRRKPGVKISSHSVPLCLLGVHINDALKVGWNGLFIEQVSFLSKKCEASWLGYTIFILSMKLSALWPLEKHKGFIIGSYKLCYLDEVNSCPQFLMKEKLLYAVSENYQKVVGFENVEFLADETFIQMCSQFFFLFSISVQNSETFFSHS